MQTVIPDELVNDPRVQKAEEILRNCVHCGFCLATCPTYQLLGDELDSPRGRIYLIKQVVEGGTPTRSTMMHLDRCLTCRNCETTCPSGVSYGHLVDQGRSLVEEQVSRPLKDRVMRSIVKRVLPYPNRIGPLVKLGQSVRSVLPKSIGNSIPIKQQAMPLPTRTHKRKMLVLDGCVQPSMSPATNASAMRVMDALGIQVQSVASAGCCGAIHFHLNDQPAAKAFMKRNIDAWWPHIEAGAERIITTASGCGLMVKDYADALADDPYADKARRISELCCDLVEAISGEDLEQFLGAAEPFGSVAYHPPCTLQHGQKLSGSVEALLRQLGFNLTPVPDNHLCCGSAGTYSLFQPKLSKQLRDNKVASILTGEPDLIATANIGCQLQLQTGLGRPVLHWVELLDQMISKSGSRAAHTN
ncbi:MAG: glycolate oxidase subunit GlcF [Gammaproteobacteria bacterium]|nr:glycolate oxidase subunit GlcF [Gammaproteobacteria bacterium]